MSRISKWRLPTIVVSLFHFGCGWGGGPESHKVEILQEEKSPNGQLVATSFSSSGGGAAGYFHFIANLRKVDDKLDARDVLMGKHPGWKAIFDIDVCWVDDKNLEVSYKQDQSPVYKENNAVKVKSKHGIRIYHLIRNDSS